MFSGSKDMTENVFRLKMKLTLILIRSNFKFSTDIFQYSFFSTRVKYFMVFSTNHVNKLYKQKQKIQLFIFHEQWFILRND